MSFDNSLTAGELIAARGATTPANAWKTSTVQGRQLRAVQRTHAAVMTIVPVLGTGLAIGRMIRYGVSAVDLLLLVGMYSITIAGITVGFHRHLSHLTFRTRPAVRALLSVAGSMAGQGPVIYWVANHRRHHGYSDQPGDPHSPFFEGERQLGFLRGLWHAHTGWNFGHDITNTLIYCKDLVRDPLIGFINKRYYFWVGAGLVLPALIGGMVTSSWAGAWSGFLWGGMVRLFLSYHATSGINSLAHRFGRRPFDTREHSRNNLLLVLPTFGEGWHNNHHAFPKSAVFGLKAWQVDLGASIIWTMERLSLAWDVWRPTAEQIENKLAASRSSRKQS
jgi:stearoyl-CoA desaturase (delta-9 desaturase)